MKTLANHVILYDDQCPMCDLYTRGFVKSGMLDKHGREAFTCMRNEHRAVIDEERARDEIALVDKATGVVVYGVESLTTIIAHSYPVFGKLLHLNFINRMLRVAYRFVSYNRKVIAPAEVKAGGCIPSYNLFYRWAYIVFAWLVTSLVLQRYTGLLSPFLPAGSFFREFMICGGQIMFQSVAVFMVNRRSMMDYLGNMMTVSLMGALMLSPFLLVVTHAPLAIILFFLVVTFMFAEHYRRTKLLRLSWHISASWVLFRILVLLIIL